MSKRSRVAIEAVLAREGGYVDHPADRGGPTNYGITLARLAESRGRRTTADDVRMMSRDEAIAIYERDYVERPGLEGILDDEIFAYMVDSIVHHGQSNAIGFLQRAAGVADDGALGPV